MVSVQEALESALATAVTALDEVDLEMKSLDEKRARLLREREGLMLALERHTGAPPATPVTSQAEATRWSTMYRNDAILEVLREYNSPLAPAELSEILQSRGRAQDTGHLISSGLSKLKDQGKVMRRGHGRWTLATRSTDAEDPVAAGSSDGVPTTASGGESDVETPDHDHRDNHADRSGDRGYRPSVVSS